MPAWRPSSLGAAWAVTTRNPKNGGISFLDRDSLIRGSSRGPAIVPGKPQESVMMDVLRHDGEIQMPPGPKLPAKEIAVLAEWIRRGAVWGAKLRQ